MKNFKLTILSFILVAFTFSSCNNDEAIDNNQQQTEESASITAALDELSSRFSNDGTLIIDENPSGNIIFDFCFDFVYPLTLSYNNGTTVSVDDFDDLIEVIINSTEDLYINGIAFPFDVEVFDEDTDGIEIETINNEEEFIDLLEDCDFDEFDCECYEEFDPVCVEIEDEDGEVFLITYPNECYAECDGFTEEDFAENCEEDYNCPGGNDCFSFNFPLTIITDDGETITVNSQEELDTVLYDANYFDFVYPFDITLNNEDDDEDDDENEVITINNEEEFFEILEDCYDDEFEDCECPEIYDPVCVEYETDEGEYIIIPFPNSCFAECEGFDEEDFVECDDAIGCEDCPDDGEPVCVTVEEPAGETTITFPNACVAECLGFSEEDFVDCE